LLRRLSVSLLKREPSKMSLKIKRDTAALENDFLLKSLAASVPEEMPPNRYLSTPTCAMIRLYYRAGTS